MNAFVFQGTRFRLYTPSEEMIPFQYCTFYLTEDADVSLTDKEGHEENSVPFRAGYQPIMVTKIRAVNNGLVYIVGHENLN